MNELRPKRPLERLRARARGEYTNVVATEACQDLSDAHHEVEDAFGLLGVVALVVTPDDVFGLGVDDHGFHRRGPDVQTHYRSMHPCVCTLPSCAKRGKHKLR